MATAAQIHANRLNAASSTGPRTPEGKARSALNARRQGFCTKSLCIAPHEQEDFDLYRAEILDQVNPQPGIQSDLFHQLLHAGGSIRRLEIAELDILNSHPNPYCDPAALNSLNAINRYRTAHHRAYLRLMAELRRLQTIDANLNTLQDGLRNELLCRSPLADPPTPHPGRPRPPTLLPELPPGHRTLPPAPRFELPRPPRLMNLHLSMNSGMDGDPVIG